MTELINKKYKTLNFLNISKYKWLFVILVLVIVFEIFNLFNFGLLNTTLNQESINKYADEVINKCKDDRYRPACYDQEIPKLMDEISMEDAFKVTFAIQGKDDVYPYCHVLAHELSAREVVKNPDNWKDVVSRCPSGMCSNGCIHGGFQERFREESFTSEKIELMKPELKVLCEPRANWNPTKLEQASCYHALGHLTMYLTEADIGDSLNLCDEFSIKPNNNSYTQICYDGAFMQIFQPLEPEDFALIKGKEIGRDELLNFCKQFSGSQYGSCWSEGWPLFINELRKPEGLVKYCSHSLPEEVERCFDSLVYVISAQFGLDSEKIINYCPGLPGDRSGRCFANSASRMIETDYRFIDKAVNLCISAKQYDKNDQCFKELLKYSSYNYHIGSPEFIKVCEALPDPWKTQCFKKS